MKLAIANKALVVAVLTMNSSVSSLSVSPSMRTVSTVFPEAKHRVDASQVQYNFDSNIPPVVKVDQGDLVHVETQDCFGGQITPRLEHPTRAVNNIPRSKLNPVTGPIYVNGAMPGDILCVSLHDIRPQGVGVACCGSHHGQLRHIIRNDDEGSDSRTKFFDLISLDGCKMVRMRDHESIRNQQEDKQQRDEGAATNDTATTPRQWKRIAPIIFPMAPMLGVVGVAPAGKESISTIPAGKHGGNLDNNCNGIGSTIYLKVNHPGALLSVGDMHASQGDGEISGNGVEIGGNVLLQCHVIKAEDLYDVVSDQNESTMTLEYPITETPSHWITHGVWEENIPYTTTLACQEAAKVLVGQWGFTAEEAFVFLSVKGNLGLCQSCHPDIGTQIAKMTVPKLPMCPRPFRCQWQDGSIPT